jgi:ABC-type antimicrobial peptide transport system permease subunit
LAALVANRIPEFGVRMALGATPADIRRAVLAQGGRLIAVGVVIGLAVASLGSSALGALLFDVDALDPSTYIGATVVIAVLGLIAADVPARRATRANPADALR